MSFLNTLLTIGEDALKGLGFVAKVGKVVVPFLGPEAAAIDNAITTGVNLAEVAITTAQQGAVKKETAGTIVAAEIPTLEEVVALFGPSVKLSDKAKAAIGAAIDGSVAVKNNIAIILAELQAAKTK